uniref:Uncharacterized protein n=1 Tax=Roseihalotalea indica TaxID=2867963 RepID=A0AA49JGB4_9BACT|nr:hypothetical protein K4G66_27800 [Tunicatimonas sp. TK19036]
MIQAQVIVQQGVVAMSGADSKVTINTSLVNQGTLIQEGELALDADLVNQSDFQAVKGVISLTGSDQIITSSSLKLGSLQIKNGYTKTLDGSFEILNKLILEEGKLTVPTASKLVLGEGAVVENSGPVSYIVGTLYHTGIGNKYYPIGSENEYAPISEQIHGVLPVVGVSFIKSGNKPFWHRTVISGDFQGSSSTVSFLSEDENFLFYQDQLVLLAAEELNSSRVALAPGSVIVDQSFFTVNSIETITLPWLTVGFAIDPELEDVFVPNAFSIEAPNPEDQCIKVYGKFISLENFQFGIQDAWGRWVYRTSSLDEAMSIGWQPSSLGGAYSKFRYVLIGEFLSGTTFRRSDVIMKF